MEMLLVLTLLICGSPRALGELEDSQFEDDIDPDLTDFDLDIVRGVKVEGVAPCGVWICASDRFFFCAHRHQEESPDR